MLGRVLLFLACGLLCASAKKYGVKPVLFINLTQAKAGMRIDDGCQVEANITFTPLISIDTGKPIDKCANMTKSLQVLHNENETTESPYIIYSELNVTELCPKTKGPDVNVGVLRHRQGLLNYHCTEPEISFFFDRFTWWALMIVIAIGLVIIVSTIFACYIDCVNRRTTMPETAKDDAERSTRDMEQSIRRHDLEKLLEASILRHRIREAEAEQAKDRRARREAQRQRMTQAQQEVTERSTESHHSSEGSEGRKSKKATERVPLAALNPKIIHKVVNEQSPQCNGTDSTPKNAQSERDKDESSEASDAKAPLLPISKVAPQAKNEQAKRRMDRHEHLTDSIELTKFKRPEVMVSKMDEEVALLTCEEGDLQSLQTTSTSPDSS
uniref:ZP domain-containing protein n=1 Tax=Steinernema glaseri TaxID=37863 RepID=A0A1I7ZXZ6_9BILA